MDLKKTLNELYGRNASEVKLGLDNIKTLLKKLGNPEKSLKCILVGGTNGKGSVSNMIASGLVEAGFNVGLYTSPHLKRFNERIKINGVEISDEKICEIYNKIKDKITNQSFFEITTAMAFLYFNDEGVDFCVLEVGLGGRLDATNVLNPLVSVITNIGLEHTRILGRGLRKVAFEKSGIIKPSVPVVTGTSGVAFETIKKIAIDNKSPMVDIDNEIEIKFKSLKGEFQQRNSKIAISVLKALKKFHNIDINDEDIKKGIGKTKIKGRFEFIDKNVIVDCAHNPDGFDVLVEEIKRLKEENCFDDVIFVIGVLKDKNLEEILRKVKGVSSKIILTKPNSDRALDPENVEGVEVIKDPIESLKYAKSIRREKDLIVCAGSFYFIGELI
tara:strand:- start:9013 stop:10173 length:1161 start_codon:yes stop_codon:yes gene_type:complete